MFRPVALGLYMAQQGPQEAMSLPPSQSASAVDPEPNMLRFGIELGSSVGAWFDGRLHARMIRWLS